MPALAFWGGASHGADAQELPNLAYRVRGPTRPCSAKSVSLGAGVGSNDGTQEASGAVAGDAKPYPAVPAGYALDLSPLLEAILQMRGSQLEFQWMMLENGSAFSRIHTVVEDAPLPTPPALPHVAMPSTGPSVLSEALEAPHLCPILPLPPFHISHMRLPVTSHSPLAAPDGRWELGSDIQVAMVKSVGTIVTTLLDTATYAKFKAWLVVEDWVASHLGTALEALGPHAVHTVARLTMMPELYAVLEMMGVLGM